jgi:glycosyltransferase involved in cell wall biosynthesis
MKKNKDWNIAFEISPILAASGSYGDKSGVYRINYNLIKHLSKYLNENKIQKKIYLYTLTPHLSFNKNYDLISLLEKDNVEFLPLPYYIVPSLMDYPISNLPFIRFIVKYLDKIYLKILENVLFVKYLNVLNEKLKELDVKIVHHSESGFANLKNCLSVIHINDLSPLKFPFWSREQTIDIHKRKLMFAEQFCEGIICISENTKKDVIGYFDQLNLEVGHKLKTIYLGATQLVEGKQPSFEKLNQIINQNSSTALVKRKYLLYFGTIEPRKNLITLTTVFLHLKKIGKLKGYKLVLVGGKGWGKTHKLVSEFIKEQYPIRNERDILLMDFISDEYLSTLISNARGVVYTPFYEGFGLPILESMQHQTPVISSDNSSMPEVGGKAVLYANPTDPKSIETAILKLVTDDDLYEKLKKLSKIQADKFSWDKNAAETFKFYESLIEKHHSK